MEHNNKTEEYQEVIDKVISSFPEPEAWISRDGDQRGKLTWLLTS